jgi:hypothetical protein
MESPITVEKILKSVEALRVVEDARRRREHQLVVQRERGLLFNTICEALVQGKEFADYNILSSKEVGDTLAIEINTACGRENAAQVQRFAVMEDGVFVYADRVRVSLRFIV